MTCPAAAPRASAPITGLSSPRCHAWGRAGLVFLNRCGMRPLLHCGKVPVTSGCPTAAPGGSSKATHLALPPLRLHRARATGHCPDLRQCRHRALGRGTGTSRRVAAEALPTARASCALTPIPPRGELETSTRPWTPATWTSSVGTQMVTKGTTSGASAGSRQPRFGAVQQRFPRPGGSLLTADASRRSCRPDTAGSELRCGCRPGTAKKTLRIIRPGRNMRLRRPSRAGQLAESIKFNTPAALLAPRPAARRSPLRAGFARDFLKDAAQSGRFIAGSRDRFVTHTFPAIARVANVERMRMLVKQ